MYILLNIKLFIFCLNCVFLVSSPSSTIRDKMVSEVGYLCGYLHNQNFVNVNF